jgi:hypothetical protein
MGCKIDALITAKQGSQISQVVFRFMLNGQYDLLVLLYSNWFKGTEDTIFVYRFYLCGHLRFLQRASGIKSPHEHTTVALGRLKRPFNWLLNILG